MNSFCWCTLFCHQFYWNKFQLFTSRRWQFLWIFFSSSIRFESVVVFFALYISLSLTLDCPKFSTIFPLAICFTSATPHVQTDFHRIHSISVHLISILCMLTLCDYWLHITHNCNDPTATANIYFIQIDFKVAIVIAWLTAILMHGESVWCALCILNGICV